MAKQQSQQNGGTHIEFREGVFVRVPGRPDVEVVRKVFGSPLAGGFQVIRPLVNFFIRDLQGNPVTNFKPSMQLIVRFTQHDLDEAANLGQDLVFAYFDLNIGTSGEWVQLAPGLPNVKRHTFFEGFEDFESFAGYRGFDAITLNAWPPDPGGAWGV